jgi:hypothetical protein
LIKYLQRQPAAYYVVADADYDRVLCQKIRLDQTMVITDHGDAVDYRTRRVVIEKAG